MYFRRHKQPVRRNPPAEAPQSVETASELAHIRDVYQAYRNTDTIITPHVGGEHSNLTWHDPTLEPAMEITSSHGSFEWAIREIIERGYQLGFLGGSDCYTGRPGDDRPGHQSRRYAKSGLTGIYTRDVTLDGFFEAMQARRVYATTGLASYYTLNRTDTGSAQSMPRRNDRACRSAWSELRRSNRSNCFVGSSAFTHSRSTIDLWQIAFESCGTEPAE